MTGLFKGQLGLWGALPGLINDAGTGYWGGHPGLIDEGTPGPTPTPTPAPFAILTVTGPAGIISGAGLVYTCGINGSQASGAASTSSKSAGKFYFEVKATSPSLDPVTMFPGIMQTNSDLTLSPGYAAASGIGLDMEGGEVIRNGITLDVIAGISPNSVVGVGLDCATRGVYFSVDGAFTHGPYTMPANGVPWMPAVSLSTQPDQWNCRFDPATWQYLPPDGSYVGWTVNATVVFDPSFNSVPNLIYAPGDRTVTRTLASGGFLGLRGFNANSTGKWYFELQAISAPLLFAGIVDALFNTSGTGGGLGDSRVGQQNVFLETFGASTAMGGTLTPAQIAHIAWDADNNLIWFKRGAGDWNNNGLADPATGVGGLSTGGLAGPAYVGVVLRQQAGAGVVCRVPGDPGYSVPAGFTPWS